MTPELVEKARQLAQNPTVCNWFQYFAQETWERIGFARTRHGLRIYETTITQNLVFQFKSSKDIYADLTRTYWGVEILESLNERTNGSDIELFVEINGSVIFFAVQAKIINHHWVGLNNGNYRYINHQVRGTDQIDLLTAYARSKGGIPLYLLYNYVQNYFDPASQCGINYEIGQFGCSIISAEYIRDNFRVGGAWTIPTFDDLHPAHALPWFVIPCCFPKMNEDQIIKKLFPQAPPSNSQIRKYTIEEVRQDPNWQVLSPFGDHISSGKDERKVEGGNIIHEESPSDIAFNPKYRILISPKLVSERSSK